MNKSIKNHSSVKKIKIDLENISNSINKDVNKLHNSISKSNIADKNVHKIKVSLANLMKKFRNKSLTKDKSKAGIEILKTDSKKVIESSSSIPKINFSTRQSSIAKLRSSKKITKKSEEDNIFPLTAIQALKKYNKELSDFEKSEIIDYKSIYYMGNGIAKMNMEEVTGYDDDKGDYNTYVGEQLNYRYEIVDILGKGSFGQALKCIDHKTQEIVAVKIIKNKKKLIKQANLEVTLLKYINEYDPDNKANIVRIFDSFTFRKHIVSY